MGAGKVVGFVSKIVMATVKVHVNSNGWPYSFSNSKTSMEI
jgi:hypothetical protein